MTTDPLKISELTAATVITGNDLFASVVSGNTRKITANVLQNFIQTGKFSPSEASASVAMDSLVDVAGSIFSTFNWQNAANTGAVRFGIVGYTQHSTNNNITGVGHYGGVLGYAQKTGTGTDSLVIGVEGRVGAPSGTITIGAPVVATFDTDTENAGTITFGAGFYFPEQPDAGHITNKFAFWNHAANFSVRSEGVINARGGLQLRDRAIEGATSWVTVNSTPSTPVVDAGFNVTSLTDGGVGIITVNVTNAFAAGHKAIVTGGEGFNVVMYDASNNTTAYVMYCISLLTLAYADGRMSAAVFGGA